MVDLADIFQRKTEPRTVLAFCDSVTLPDGPYRGDVYDPLSEAPQQVAVQALDGDILDAEGKPFRDITLAWCTQAGKSLSSVLVPALHSVVERQESVVYCLPSLDLLNKVWIDKLKPGIEGAGYASWLPEKGPGSKGGRPSSLMLRDPSTGIRAGSIIFVAGGVGAKKEAGQAGVTAATVLLDEADEYEDAHRIALVRQRAAAFGSEAITIAASTVKKDHGSIILSLVEDGTDSRIYYKCPHCGHYQPLDWEHVQYEGTDDISVADSARYTCQGCGVLWTEKDRRNALCDWRLVHKGQTVDERGNVVGPVPRTKSFGLKCSKLDFAIGLGLPELCVEHAKAQRHYEISGDHGLLRSFFRDRISQMYRADDVGVVLDNRGLAQVSENSPTQKGYVPDWAEYLTISADVQLDRVYWQVMAHGDEVGQSAIVDWGYEYICEKGETPSTKQRHATFDRIQDIASEGWAKIDDEPMVPLLAGIDSGFAEPDVMSWCDRSGWIAIKGAGRHQIKRMQGTKQQSSKTKHLRTVTGWAEIRKQEDHRTPVWHIDADNAKQQVHRGLTLTGAAPGRLYIPNGLPSNNYLILHLTAEIWTQDETTSKWFWKEIRTRNDMLDCAAYNLVMANVMRHEKQRKTQQPKRTYGAQ